MLVISSINNNEKKNAGPKAPNDIDKILEKKYDAKIIKLNKNKFYKYKVLLSIIKSLFHKGIIVLQHPVIYNHKLLRLLPKDRTIILIHDISGLRNQDDMLLSKEISIFKQFKYIIVHNQSMKQYLVEKGIESQNITCLEIFDYLTKDKIKTEHIHILNEKVQILYPGNLKKEKSPFIYQLNDKKMEFQLNLYGIGINNNINEKVIYKGSFESDEISNLEGDLGLIWDGNYDESDENEKFKNYTKYNNPHKLSCCLAMGKPVIVWKKSAISKFVEDNDVGYLISNIYDINNLDFRDFEVKKKNAISFSKRLRDGDYTINVFEKILQDMEKR